MEQAVLACEGLCCRYGARPALRGVSLSVAPGRILGLLGPSGAGKTTLLKLAAGLALPSAGTVRVCGLAPGTASKRAVSYLPDAVALPAERRAGELVALYAQMFDDFDTAKARALLAQMGVAEDMRVRAMSRGAKEKTQLALAMSHGAELLILDEPTSGLDPVSRGELTALFRELARDRGIGILFSTHITGDLERCADRVVLMRSGSVVSDDTLDGTMRRFAGCGRTLDDILISVERGYGDGRDAV